MTGVLFALHPTFDALSAEADRSDVDAAHSRVGRHVARCAACRTTVAEIRALGTAARAMRAGELPAGLWTRIESAVDAGRPSVPASVGIKAVDQTPVVMLPPLQASRRRQRGVTVAIAALAATLILAIGWPRPSGLEAAATTRLTFVPARPVPGQSIELRLRPQPWMKDVPRLVLVGSFAKPAGSKISPFGASVFEELGDSLGVLTRAADGAFVGTLALPADFLAVRLRVADRDRDRFDGDRSWLVIGGTKQRGPSLPALLAALEIASSMNGYGSRLLQPVNVPDSLQRYFPAHPAGWAFSHTYGVSRGRFDFLRFFQTAERKYSAMFDALWPARVLDGERLHDMVVFASNIDEPDEVLRWASRLAQEHPEDPRALFDLAGALHGIELRDPPAVADTIRSWLPVLDRTYRAGPVPNYGFEDALRLGLAYGDSSTAALWRSRRSANSRAGNIWLLARWSQPASRDSLVRELRARATQSCELPPGRLPMMQTVEEWRARCELYRGIAFGFLSSQSLSEGRAHAALAEADSAIGAMKRGEFCAPSRGFLSHALASLALGDTLTAERDFATGAAGYPPGMTFMLDSARVHLGGRFDRATYDAGVDSAVVAARACTQNILARRKARRQDDDH